MKRKLKDGITFYFETCKNKIISKILYKLANLIDLNGCINIQLKILKGVPKIFEINPRLSSTVYMRHELGFNDLVLWINDKLKLDLKVSKTSIKSKRIFRLSNFGVLKIKYKMKYLLIIQARLNSQRLKNKIIKKVKKEELILHQIKRLQLSDKIDQIIVACTNKKNDNKLVRLLEKNNIQYFRGSEKMSLIDFISVPKNSNP